MKNVKKGSSLQGFCYFGKSAQPLLDDAQSSKIEKNCQSSRSIQDKNMPKILGNVPVRAGRGALVRGVGVLNHKHRTFQAHPKPSRTYRARQCIKTLDIEEPPENNAGTMQQKTSSLERLHEITVKHLENHVRFMCGGLGRGAVRITSPTETGSCSKLQTATRQRQRTLIRPPTVRIQRLTISVSSLNYVKILLYTCLPCRVDKIRASKFCKGTQAILFPLSLDQT